MFEDGAIDIMFDCLQTPVAEKDGAVVGELCATVCIYGLTMSNL